MQLRFLTIAAALALAGCAQSSVMQTSANSVAITRSAAPVCGGAGAQQVAYQRAAIETLRRGYDSFIITGADAANNVRVVGVTPVQAQTYGTATGSVYGNTLNIYGNSSTYYTGGSPIVGGSHDQALSVVMFHAGEAGAANAVDAKQALGPDWATLVKNPPQTC